MNLLLVFANTLLGHLPTASDDPRIKSIPKTVETAEKRFNLHGRTTIYAVCPSCHFTYDLSTILKAPPGFKCMNQIAPDQPPCHTRVLDDGSQPFKTFEYHHFADYLASLLSRPGMEELMDQFSADVAVSASQQPADILRNACDGSFLREFMGPDGKHLFVCGQGEGRYVFAFHIDYFAVEGNTLRGAKTGCGIITMSCLNLPMDIRYDPANMYLVGVIPGPYEPSLDEERHYVRPVIDDMAIAWSRGIHFSKTALRPTGLMTRSAIALMVADFPAGRRTTGQAGVTGHYYCTVCKCWHTSTLGRTDFEKWVPRDNNYTRKCASQ
jgi:hypothetical protein